ncbi:MAG: hypothetical protein ACHQFW_03775 [Chitinophagales bacterium]
MNKWLVVAGFVVAAFCDGCSTDFDLNADFKETPVIYALLDASVDTQFIRINRAFLNDDVDAITMAAFSDSIYYGDELIVSIEEYNNGSFITTYPVQRVDGDTLGIPKQGGLFANSPNILYRFIADLDYTHSYKIIAENIETGITVSAETALVDSFAITRPDDEGIFPQNFSVSPQGIYQLRWKTAQDAKIYDVALRFHYREGTYFPDGDSIHYTNAGAIDWKIESNYTTETTNGGLTVTYNVDGASFYSFIESNFDPVDDLYFIRIADSIQFIIDAGGNELFNYFEYNNATLGITEGQISDAYTNVNGGLGILSSRFHKEGKIYTLSTQTRDSIACSSVTSGLNFAPNVTTPGFPYCE